MEGKEKGNARTILMEEPTGKRPLGRSRRRWTNDIKMDVGEMGWDGIIWPGLI
jgi:hypothetical protein